MLTNKEYDELISKVIKYFKNKKFNAMYVDIIEDIEDLDEAVNQCNNKEKSFSSLMYQVKFLKSQYAEELKDVIMIYNEIIFKDFSFKNDLNTMINGAHSLKVWLVRYLCVDNLNIELSELIKKDLENMSVTCKYQEIDNILFKKTVNKTVTSK